MSIINYTDNIIKYSQHCIIFFDNNYVYKQYPIKPYKWINEIAITNYLSHDNIIKFKECVIMEDYVIDTANQEILTDKTETVIRIIMDKYETTLDNITTHSDGSIFYIMERLLSALIYCNLKNILHRDIKEKNILVNMHPNKDDVYINDMVLCDFGISKYGYKHNKYKQVKILTASHRPPEIWVAMSKKLPMDYDERVDVWAFCIVLSFMITGQSFYKFLQDGYLQIDAGIMSDVKKLEITMKHFLKIYTCNTLKHKQLFTKIIFMGITKYNNRCYFDDIRQEILAYSDNYRKKYDKTFITNFQPTEFIPVIRYPIRANMNYIYIHEFHNIINNDDNVLLEFYKSILHLNSNKKSKVLALYIILTFIHNDYHKPLAYYIDMAKTITTDAYFSTKPFLDVLIEKKILKIIQKLRYNIIY